MKALEIFHDFFRYFLTKSLAMRSVRDQATGVRPFGFPLDARIEPVGLKVLTTFSFPISGVVPPSVKQWALKLLSRVQSVSESTRSFPISQQHKSSAVRLVLKLCGIESVPLLTGLDVHWS